MKKCALTVTSLVFVLVIISLFGVWDIASAERGVSHCDIRGSWWGDATGFGLYLVSYDGATPNSGTDDIEFFGTSGSSPFYTSGRGAWTRIAPNKFAYTFIYYGKQTDGTLTSIIKLSGVKTLSSDCNEMQVESAAELFVNPYADPIDDSADYCVPAGTSNAKRIIVEEPCTN